MKKAVLRYRVLFFYAITFAISWPAWSLMPLVKGGSDSVYGPVMIFSTLGGLGPLLSLAILSRLSGGEISLNGILSRIKLRGAAHKGWMLPAILAYPAFTLLGTLVRYLAGGQDQLHLIKSGPDTLGLAVLPVMAIHFVASLITSPLFEEPGWRGFALVELQRTFSNKRFGRLLCSLIVGSLWWLWHQPMNLAFGIQPSLYSFVSMLAFSFLIDSLFNLSGGNLFFAMLAHQSSGTTFTFLYGEGEDMIALGALVLFVIVLRFIEWRGARPEGQAAPAPAPLA